MVSAMGDDDPLIGKTIEGRYVLQRRIGRGGMGVVYEAEHAALDRRVAVKLIAAEQAPEAYLTRFRREAKLASRITHEHLVHIYDVGIDLDTNADFIVMEYVEGRDLGKELEAGPMGFARTISIARQLLHALHAIHEGEIIHRDIKPTNVMLTTRNGERDFVKLMDFGIARAVGDASLTVTGHVVGTPSFMSPEQLRGQEVDRRSDLYAVGITLFAMIAGRLPFDGNTALLAGQHVFQPPPSLAKLRPGTPPALIAAVERALAKSPAERFPDALAFAAALDGTAPPPIAATAQLAPPGRRSRVPIIAGVLVAMAALGAVIWLVQRSPSTPATPATVATPAPPPRVQVDAAVPVVAIDAGVDAAELAAGPDTPIPTSPNTPPDRRPKPPVDKGPPLTCHCIPTNAPDIIGLCATKGASLCRCDATNGASLCPTPLVVKKSCTVAEGLDCAPNGVMCSDRQYTAYHRPGHADEPCTGYAVPRFGEPDPERKTGHLECDVCAGAKLDAFKGHDGDACSGFYWRTGETKTGKLAHCQ
jgi:serine/threonine-protein kinase